MGHVAGSGRSAPRKRAALHAVQLCRRWLCREASLLPELTRGLGDAVGHRGQQVAQAREDAGFQSEEVPGARRKPQLEGEEDRTPWSTEVTRSHPSKAGAPIG